MVDKDTMEVVFSSIQYIQIYAEESLDNGEIHDFERCADFYNEFPEFIKLLPEDPRGRQIIPFILLQAPAVGLFRQCVGQGFLLRSISPGHQRLPIFLGDRVTYTIRKFLLTQTVRGLKVYECEVEARKTGNLVNTYAMTCVQPYFLKCRRFDKE